MYNKFMQAITSHLSDQQRQSQEIAKLIGRFAEHEGMIQTAVPALYLYRYSSASEPMHGLCEPALCLVAQGSKQVMLGETVLRYDPDHYLLISVDMPITGQVIQASPEIPCLGLRLDLDPGLIGTILMEANFAASQHTHLSQGLVVSPVGSSLQDAILRLVRLLETPEDIAMLAPLIVREIIYRLMRGEQSAQLCQIASANAQTQRIALAIDWLKRNYDQPLHIDVMAREVHMSSSALHHSFKAVTAMSPLQYQKQLRLQEARRLMLGEALDAASASYRVGYESPTQFSREYSRLFGEPPLRDITRLRTLAPEILTVAP